jgi:hypothetical protein
MRRKLHIHPDNLILYELEYHFEGCQNVIETQLYKREIWPGYAASIRGLYINNVLIFNYLFFYT